MTASSPARQRETDGLSIAVAPRTSTARAIADALRTAIVEGALAPGAPLRQDALARHFSVSAIPVREALRQLASEGWASIEVHKGASVALLSSDEAREIYEIRSALESLALSIAIPHHTRATLNDARALHRAARRERDPALYVAHNEAFHLSLCAPAARPQLLGLIGTLHQRGKRYLRLKFGFPAHKRASDDEHAAILDAVERRDIAAAQTLAVRHLLDTGELIHAVLTASELPEGSAPRRTAARTRSSIPR